MPVLEANIPVSLLSLRRWVCWRWIWDQAADGGKGKWTKPLFDPRTGRHASSNDTATWSDFDTVISHHRRGEYDGIGITLGCLDDGLILAGVDLDGVRDLATGRLASWADWTLRRLDSYAEVSPSQTGVKALCWGKLPTGRRADHETGIEMYDCGRYWTVTGRHIDHLPAEVMDRADALRQLHAELLMDPQKNGTSRTLRATSDCGIALSALAALNTRRAVGYSDWLAVGMALHSVDSSASMLSEWDRWSKSAPDRYTEGACARKWTSFGKGGLTISSLIYWARQDGWSGPALSVNTTTTASAPAPAAEKASAEQLTDLILDTLLHDPVRRAAMRQIVETENDNDVLPAEY
jgi:hypothetical protein